MKVKLTYFKPSGKYYSSGEYETRLEPCTTDAVLFANNAPAMHSIFDEVKRLSDNRGLPDLVKSSYGWIILVDVPDHPHNHPALINTECVISKFFSDLKDVVSSSSIRKQL